MMIPRGLIEIRDRAMDDETYLTRCIYGEKVYWYPAEQAYAPGHIYSLDGKNEYGISNCCEWHFDQMFKEDEADDGDVPQDSDPF